MPLSLIYMHEQIAYLQEREYFLETKNENCINKL